MDLPDKVYETVPVFLSDEQDRHYDEISEQMLFQLDELEPETIYRMFAALQAVIAGQYVHDNGKHFTTKPMFSDPMENPRICGLMNLLSNSIGDEKCIIFCKYTFEIDTICGILGEKAVSFTGDVPQKRRKEIIDSFAGVKQYFVANKTSRRLWTELAILPKCSLLFKRLESWNAASIRRPSASHWPGPDR